MNCWYTRTSRVDKNPFFCLYTNKYYSTYCVYVGCVPESRKPVLPVAALYWIDIKLLILFASFFLLAIRGVNRDLVVEINLCLAWEQIERLAWVSKQQNYNCEAVHLKGCLLTTRQLCWFYSLYCSHTRDVINYIGWPLLKTTNFPCDLESSFF